MLTEIIEICREHPQIVIFLTLALGYLIGKIKIYNFSLGSTTGVLIAAIVLGQINVQVPALLSTVGFALFIFCIGYQVGPQFFGSLKKDGFKYVLLALVVALVGLVTAIVLGKLFSFDSGTTAGMLGGAMTQSSTIGTAADAVQKLSITAVQKSLLDSNIAVAYAITYIFGTVGLIVLVKLLALFMRVNLKAEASALEQKMSGGVSIKNPSLFSWYKSLNLRAYRVTNKKMLDMTVRKVEALFSGNIAVEKIKRKDEIIEATPALKLKWHDIVAVVGENEQLIKANKVIGPETDDGKVMDITGEILSVCVLSRKVIGRTLGQISKKYGHGCFLRKIIRQGHEIPITRDTVIKKCDILQIAGAQKDVEHAVKDLGYAERPTTASDLIMIGFGIALGTLLGMLSIPIVGIPITLGVGGGVLVSGLIFGWLRALHPTFGRIPSGAQWIFTNFGLNLFIACIGLTAGPKALHAIETTGVSLFVAGAIVTIIPIVIGLFFGKFILRLNPVLLFGALAGAQTNTATLNSLKEDADSTAPALGYTVPFAFGNVLLTIWGTVIVNVMHMVH